MKRTWAPPFCEWSDLQNLFEKQEGLWDQRVGGGRGKTQGRDVGNKTGEKGRALTLV